MRRMLLMIFMGALSLPSVFADEFPKLYNSEADKNAEPMPAETAAKRFEVPNGFYVGVFASEPDVQNPIAMTWDPRGRLWIAENYTYAERSQRFDLSLRDRVIVLEDADGDGKADKRTVFTNDVQMLTGIEVGHGGVWLMCPPRLLFIPDKNHDDKPDGPAVAVLDGFEVAKENYHNFANGLKWGPDGWLYGRCGGSCPGRIGVPGTPDEKRIALEGGIWRYSPRSEKFEALCHGTTNPWGHDWDAFGEGFFINTVNGHLWHLIPGAHFHRPFTLDPNPHVYELIDMHADHWHFDTKGSWTQSRDGAANDFGGGHAHSGMMIYQGDNWPKEYRGNLSTINLHGRRTNQELLKREGSGYVAGHGKDLLIAKDPFFRGLDLSYGPDGAVYLIDWSDTGECHEHTGVHRTSGRVFRVSYRAGHDKSAKTDLRKRSPLELAALMQHENEWYTRQARLLLAERKANNDPGISDAVSWLKQMLKADDPQTAFRALATLGAMHSINRTDLEKLLSHPNEHLRVWAIRLLTDDWPLDDIFGPTATSLELRGKILIDAKELLPRLKHMAAVDESGLVRLTLASTLQRLPVELRGQLARPLMERQEDAEDHNLPLLVWYGLMPVAEEFPMDLAEFAGSAKWPKTQNFIARRLAEFIEKKPAVVEPLVQAAIESDKDSRHNLLAGLATGLKGWSRAPQPANWKSLVKATEENGDQKTSAIVRELSVLFGDGRALEEVRRLVLDDKTEIGVRLTALKTLVGTGDQQFEAIYLSLLSDARLNAVAAAGLAKSSDEKAAMALIRNYRRFRAPKRPRVIEILASRKVFVDQLLKAIEANRIPASDLTAFDVRQIRSLEDEEINKRVSALWGEVRVSPEEKRRRIESLKRQLTDASLQDAVPGKGRALFNKTCAKCHRLFGQGEAIGPDLTGANRSNLDYLLENIIDPSAVLSKDYRMSVIQTSDGRVLNGLVIAQTDKTLTLQTQTEKITVNRDSIEAIKQTSKSPMPDGLLDNLTAEQIRDLISYLKQPAQVQLISDRKRTK